MEPEELPPPQNGVEEDAPRNGVELAQRIGAALDEGVVVALFPERLGEVVHSEASYLDSSGNHCFAVASVLGPWGVRLLDVEAPNGEPIKWWKVREVASIETFDLVPVRWHGPIGEIPERYFRDDAILGVRFYHHAPWFFPGQKPDVAKTEKEEKSEQNARNDIVADQGASGGEGAADADRDPDPAEGGA